MLEEEEDVVLGLAGPQLLEVRLELGDVVGEEEARICQEGRIARVLERLRGAPVKVEEVGGGSRASAPRSATPISSRRGPVWFAIMVP